MLFDSVSQTSGETVLVIKIVRKLLDSNSYSNVVSFSISRRIWCNIKVVRTKCDGYISRWKIWFLNKPIFIGACISNIAIIIIY